MDSMIERNQRKFVAAIGFAIIACVGPIVLLLYAIPIWRQLTIERWRESTSPLLPKTVVSLCTEFPAAAYNGLCDPTKEVYGPDFYPLIIEYFKVDPETLTFETVQEKLEAYLAYCEPEITLGDGRSYFRCFYDFRGDFEHPLVFSFFSDSSVKIYYNFEP